MNKIREKNRSREKEENGTPPRSGVLLLFSSLLFLGILFAGARFVHLQVIEAPSLREQAESQRLRQIETPAQRGTIFDRAGRRLAQSVRVYTVVVDPHNIALFHKEYVETQQSEGNAPRLSLEDLHKELANYYADQLDACADELLPQFARTAESGSLSRYSVLARQILPEVRADVSRDGSYGPEDDPEQRLFKQAIRHTVWELDYMRIYPLGEVGAQIVGFVNADGVGGAGIEMQYEDLLRGTPGVSFTERDAVGNIIPAGLQRSIEAQKGSDIILTIDAEITHVAQREVAAAVEATGAQSASAIVMNPRTGEIYAAVSYPTFDPNDFNTAEQDAIRNRALTDVLEPGSTIKPLTFAAAFDTGTITLEDSFHVPNSMQVGTRVISDAVERPAEQMSVSRIMEVSSNVGTTRIAHQLGSTDFYDYLYRFGITERPGLDFPGAGRGHVLTPQEWNDVSLSNFSFGQGLSMTPIQLTRAFAAIANDGEMLTPHLLREVPDGSFTIPERESSQAISVEAAQKTTDTLRAVMTEGTGRRVAVSDYEVAGKTGTAQKAREGIAGYIEGLYISSFIGYLPADDPELLITVFVDEPRTSFFGAEVAGPPFANIATFAVRYLGLVPSSP